MNGSDETVVVLATPVGRGAIATIIVEGPAAGAAVATHLRTARPIDGERQLKGVIILGRWGDAEGEEVVVCRRSADRWEIHSHGGIAASRAILADLYRSGCREEPWTEWISRHAPNRLAAAAQIMLASAPTERTAAILFAQYEGALARELGTIRSLLSSGEAGAAAHRLREVLKFAAVGRHLVEPYRVVVAGPPNVGKSSLVNALVGYQRSIVFNEPGTTRDVVKVTTALDGWPVELADTAGLRADGGAIEEAGMALARREMCAADLVLLIFDYSLPWSNANGAIVDEWPAAIVVHNKCDLAEASPADRPSGILTSALTGEGLAELIAAIVARLVPAAPSAKAAVPFKDEQTTVLAAVLEAVESGDLQMAVDCIDALLAARE